MRLNTPLLALMLASTGLADFSFGTKTWSIEQSKAAAATSAAGSALSSYLSEVTAAPEYSSALDALAQYQETGFGVPEDVTATDVVLTYATTPDWFLAMPTDTRQYFESVMEKQEQIIESAIADVRNAAPATSRGGVLVWGAVAAGLVGAAGLL